MKKWLSGFLGVSILIAGGVGSAHATTYDYGVALYQQTFALTSKGGSPPPASCFPVNCSMNFLNGSISFANNQTSTASSAFNLHLPPPDKPKVLAILGSAKAQNDANVTLGAIHLASSTYTRV